jgi:hypothetical protein
MKNNLSKSLNESINLIKSNFRYFLMAIGFDIVFIVMYGFISGAFLEKMYEYVQAIGSVALSAEGIRSSVSPTISNIIINSQTTGYFVNLLILMVLLFISLYFIFSFLIGGSTYIAFNINTFSKKDMVIFIKKIYKIMIPWTIILIIRQILSFYYFYLDTARTTLGLGKTYFSYIDFVIMIVIVYLILISFILPKKDNIKQTIKIGFKKPMLFLSYIINLILLLILSYIAIFVTKLNLTAGLLYDAFIVLGMITFIRIYFKIYYTKIIIKNKNIM